jgi:hypothetical protein
MDGDERRGKIKNTTFSMRGLWITGVAVTCLVPSPKQNCLIFSDMKHFPLSRTITPGTENADNILSLKALIVTKVGVSLTGVSQTNVEKAST